MRRSSARHPARFGTILGAIVLLASLAPRGLVAPPPALASHTSDPTDVTLVGDLQSEAGCPGDWDPGCVASHLSDDANDDVW